MIYSGKMRKIPVAPLVEKRVHLLEQVITGESSSNFAPALITASVPLTHFFARLAPHGVAMLRNIC